MHLQLTTRMNNVISEITPLTNKDIFFLVDRYKKEFTYPLHKHVELELNFVENCKGVKRIVGDSIEVLGDYDLVLIGSNVEHEWQQNTCPAHDIREITIQFSPDLVSESLLGKTQFESIDRQFEDAKRGIAFSTPAIMRIFNKIDAITKTVERFYQNTGLLEILYDLSQQKDYHILASSSFAKAEGKNESRRIQVVTEYISKHFAEEIKLQTLADMVYMSPSSFSRFFKLRTGKNISDYILDTRIGFASRMLADSIVPIVDICYKCGFNNASYFNRIFRKKKGCTPTVFRSNYHKHKIII